MKKQLWFNTLACVALMLTVCGCAVGEMNYTRGGSWKYKMTVTVATPEGDKTGSAVREVTINGGLGVLPEMSPRVDLKGEAVVVDLGQRGVVFALLTSTYYGADYGQFVPLKVYSDIHGGFSDVGTANYQKLPKGVARELTPTQYPMFVRFKNPQDPKTIENLLKLKPRCTDTQGGQNTNNCIANDHFAEGVALKSVTIEMTDEPVTAEVAERYLPWLSEYRNKMFDGQRYNTAKSEYPFANSIAAGAFKAGNYK